MIVTASPSDKGTEGEQVPFENNVENMVMIGDR